MNKLLDFLRLIAYVSIASFFFDLYFNDSHYVVIAKEEVFIQMIEFLSNNTYFITMFITACIVFFIVDTYKFIMSIVRLKFEERIVEKKTLLKKAEEELNRIKQRR